MTKNPANSMNGMMTIGVKLTATYLFETADPMIIPSPPDAAYDEKLMNPGNYILTEYEEH